MNPLKKDLIVKFMQAIGIHDPSPVGHWLMGQCPLAPWRHKKGKDTRPSFGIDIETGNYNCFTCDSGSLDKLVQSLEMYVKDAPNLAARFHFEIAHEILQGIEDFLDPLTEYEEITAETFKFTPWPEWWIKQYPKWDEHKRSTWYLNYGRVEMGSEPVHAHAANFMELRYDPQFDRIICPFRTFTGRLAGARGRACSNDAKLKHFDYTWNGINNAGSVWYNEPALESAARHRKPIIVVEGQFDAMNVFPVWPWVIAGLTAKSSDLKIRKLQNCEAVITMLDNDATGEEARFRYISKLKKYLPVGQMIYPPTYKDPASVPFPVMKELFSELISD